MLAFHQALMWALLFQSPGAGHFAKEPSAPAHRGWADPLLYRDLLADSVKGLRKHEAVEMFSAIVNGSSMGPGEGWFHGSSCKYDWKWLTSQLDLEGEKSIKRKKFPGPLEWFDRLDRNRDGVLTAEDFDHGDKPPALRPMHFGMLLMKAADADEDGEISKAEWEAFFKQASKGKDAITLLDLQDVFKAAMMRMMSGEAMSPTMLAAGLLSGDIGSICEGPKVGQRGLDFTLKTHDGKRSISLSDYRGHKPVVLIFGSFS